MKVCPSMSPAEAEFLAESESVTVIPNFEERELQFLTGDFGPFVPGLPTDVPIWLAMNLKLRRKCKIHPPIWLDVERLKEVKEAEINNEVFTKPPSVYYMEISSMLLRSAAEDIPKADEIRTLIKDIWDVRMAKLRKSVNVMVLRQEPFAQIDNLTVMEMNQVRTLLLPALNEMHNMRCYVTQLPTPAST